MGLDLTIDVETDILDFDPTPPAKVLRDYIPIWLITLTRRLFGFPNATPFETWLISLIFVKQALQILLALHREETKAAPFFSESGVDHEVEPQELN